MHREGDSPPTDSGRPPVLHVGREVSCRPIGFFFREMEKAGHPPETLLEGLSISRERISARTGRIDWYTFHRFLENVGRVWDDEQLLEAGKRLTVSRWVQPFGVVARLISSPRELYRWNFRPGGISDQMFTCLQNDVRKDRPGELHIHCTMALGYAPSRPLMRICRGSLMVIPQLVGYGEAKVEMRETEDSVDFFVEYPPARSAVGWFRSKLAFPGAARTAARELREVREELFVRSDQLESESTVRASAEAALRESEGRFYKAFHAAPSLTTLSTLEGTVIDANESFVKASGFSRSELIGRNIEEFNLWQDLELRRRLIGCLRAGEPVRNVEARFKTRSGEDRIGLISCDLITVDGEPCVISQAIDITARKRAEHENRTLHERMLQSQKLEGLGVMAGGIAHDFNNLLVGMLGNAELALQEIDPAHTGVRRRVESIFTASQRAADLTREMLAYAGKARISIAPMDLVSVAVETSHLARSGLPKNVVLCCDADSTPIWIEGDHTRIRQLIMNLLTNAAEAYGDDGGEVVLRVRKVRVDREYLVDSFLGGSLAEGDCTAIEVRDRGCGMNAETLKKIFDPFFTTKFTGRGLGLAAALGIVKSHGGALKVRSAPGDGTVFEVLFPLTQALPAEDEPLETSHAGSCSGCVLIVDDDPSVRDVAGKILQFVGYRTVSAEGGEQALAILRQRLDEIDAVLLDLTMPGMSGPQTFDALRSLRPDLPVVCCSGHGEDVGMRSIAGKPRATFVAKPFTAARIREGFGEVLDPAAIPAGRSPDRTSR